MQVRNVKRIDKQTALTFSSEKSSIKERRLLCHQKEEEGKAGDIQPRLRQPLIESIDIKIYFYLEIGSIDIKKY